MMNDYISMVVNGYINSLIIHSRAGLGKTYSVNQILDKLGLKKGINYLSISNYITPIEMFNLLVEVQTLQEPKLLVLDDIETILKEKKIIGLLRGALWGINGHRTIHYLSTTSLIQTKRIEEFKGRFIFMVNEFPKDNLFLNALKDRGLYYHFDLSNQEILKVMETKIISISYRNLSPEERFKVFIYLKKITNDRVKLSLRDLIKAYDCYCFSKDRWQLLIKKQLWQS